MSARVYCVCLVKKNSCGVCLYHSYRKRGHTMPSAEASAQGLAHKERGDAYELYSSLCAHVRVCVFD